MPRRRVRNDRSARPTRTFKLGNFLIITDTECSEKNYFDGFVRSLPETLRSNIRVETIQVATSELVEEAKRRKLEDAQYRETWIVFDRDEVKYFDQIISKAKQSGINVAWSNPCLEIWFFAYFGTMPIFNSSVDCVREFGRRFRSETGRKYVKNEPQIFELLEESGSRDKALHQANIQMKRVLKSSTHLHPSKLFSVTAMHFLIQELTDRTQS